MKRLNGIRHVLLWMVCLVMLGFAGAGASSVTAQAGTEKVQEVLEESGAESVEQEQPTEEESFLIFFAVGLVLLLAVVAAVVTVIVSGTTASVLIADSDEE